MNPAAVQYGGGPGGSNAAGGLMPAQQMPYDISTSPPQQIDNNEHYHNFP